MTFAYPWDPYRDRFKAWADGDRYDSAKGLNLEASSSFTPMIVGPGNLSRTQPTYRPNAIDSIGNSTERVEIGMVRCKYRRLTKK